MADSKVTQLTESTSPASTDLVYVVANPAGTPADRKVKLSNLLTAIGAQPLDSDLTAIAALTTTSYGRALLALADAAALRTAAGLGTAAVVNTGTSGANVPTITQADARYQALDSDLTAIAALSTTSYGRAFLALADAAAARTAIDAQQAGTSVQKSGDTMTGDLVVPDEAYDATAWNGSLEVPTKNAVRDKIEALTAVAVSYNPAGPSGATSVIATYADVDPVNLQVTFVAPPSGSVEVELSALQNVAGGGAQMWNLRDAGTNIAGTETFISDVVGGNDRRKATMIVTGLTPGASYTWKWGFRISVAGGSNTATIYYGNSGGATPYGAAVIQVRPVA